MLIQKHGENLHGGITPKTLYFNRRQLLAGLPAAFLGARELLSPSGAQAAAGLGALAKSRLSTSEKASPFKDVATYNNFYEEPARNSPRNWPKTSRRAPGSFRWKAKPESRARSQWRKSSKSRHSGQWYRSYGNELWEFDDDGLMRKRLASINDAPISVAERRVPYLRPFERTTCTSRRFGGIR